MGREAGFADSDLIFAMVRAVVHAVAAGYERWLPASPAGSRWPTGRALRANARLTDSVRARGLGTPRTLFGIFGLAAARLICAVFGDSSVHLLEG